MNSNLKNELELSDISEILFSYEKLMIDTSFYRKSINYVRRYKGSELSGLVGVTLQAIYNAEREGRLPKPDLVPGTTRRAGATHSQMLNMQKMFDTRPGRGANEPALVMGFMQIKRDCWTTTTAWYAGSYYAMKGYRVLLVDTDPLASLGNYCNNFSSENKKLHDNESWGLEHVVRDTAIENLKFISLSIELPSWQTGALDAEGTKESLVESFERFKAIINNLRGKFDIVILDGAPWTGEAHFNSFLALDVLLIPLPVSTSGLRATIKFLEIYRRQGKKISTSCDHPLPDMFFLPTQYCPSKNYSSEDQNEILNIIRGFVGRKALNSVIVRHDSVVGSLSKISRTVFEINRKDFNLAKDDFSFAVDNFTNVCSGQINPDTFLNNNSWSTGDLPPLAECSRCKL